MSSERGFVDRLAQPCWLGKVRHKKKTNIKKYSQRSVGVESWRGFKRKGWAGVTTREGGKGGEQVARERLAWRAAEEP